MSSLSPSSLSDVFIDVGIDTDPQDLLNDAYTYLSDVIPGWSPAAGNLDVWILMAVASLAAESRDVASTVPSDIFRWFGANLVNLPPIDDAQATLTSTWTMINTNGYTIPAGTQVSIPVPGGDDVPFITVTDTVVAPGSSVVSGVVLEAVNPGAAANQLGTISGPITLLDTLTFVSGVVQQTLPIGGQDAELDSDYLNRLSAELELLAPRPILASDFAIFSRNVPNVFRAVAIDLYNPYHNLLSLNDASLETSVGDWVNKANATVTQDATFGVDGTKSLKLVSVAAGDMTAVVGVGGNVPVVVGETYTFLATVKPVSARTCYVGVDWYTAGNVFISTVYGAGVAVGAGATQALTATLVAPATAAFARPVVRVAATAAAGEVANFDKMSVRHGTTTDWVAGGTAETNVPRAVAVAAMDVNGNAIDTATKANLLAYLQAAREVNFLVSVIDPTTNLIDVTVTYVLAPGWDPTLVHTNVQAAIQSYLSALLWGNNTATDAPQDWTNTTVLRYLELATVINNAPGVGYVQTLTFGPHGGALSSADLTLVGQAPVAVASTLSITP